MAVKPDETYEATVDTAVLTRSREKKTIALAISFNTADGKTKGTWWVTPNTVDRLGANLNECFGVDTAKLRDVSFLSKIGEVLKGKPCSIVTELQKDTNGNVYQDTKGNTYVVVKWLNASKLGIMADESDIARAADIFAGFSSDRDAPPEDNPAPSSPGGGSLGIDDSDVPF